jgi:hypothetical protein
VTTVIELPTLTISEPIQQSRQMVILFMIPARDRQLSG